MKTVLFPVLFSIVSCYLEEAPYEVTKEYGGWEVRKYPPTKWISTDAQDVAPHNGKESTKAFHRLFDYIDGTNDQNTKIPMTAPVTFRIIPGPGEEPDSVFNYTMSFYIPSSLQDVPPQPLDPLVYFEERPGFEVVSKQFGGFPTDLVFNVEAAMLYVWAEEEGLPVKDVPLWTAGYDGPYVIINRRNEVWLEI